MTKKKSVWCSGRNNYLYGESFCSLLGCTAQKGMVYAWIPAIKTAFEFIQLEHPYDESWWQFSKKNKLKSFFRKFLSFIDIGIYFSHDQLVIIEWCVFTQIFIWLCSSWLVFVWIVGILFSTVYVYKENDILLQQVWDIIYMVKHTQQLLILALFIRCLLVYLTKILLLVHLSWFYLMIDKN